MAYDKFSYKSVEELLNLTFWYDEKVFEDAVPVAVDPLWAKALEPSPNYPLTSEQSRREWIIVNVFKEWIKLTDGNITVYSAVNFDVEPSLGLTGEADFLITQGKGRVNLTHPVIAVAEAKPDNLLTGVGQCIAEMYAAFIFNERKGKPVKRIFGVVTTGSLWGFLVLEGKTVKMDSREYTLSNLDEILGILIYMTKNVY